MNMQEWIRQEKQKDKRKKSPLHDYVEEIKEGLSGGLSLAQIHKFLKEIKNVPVAYHTFYLFCKNNALTSPKKTKTATTQAKPLPQPQTPLKTPPARNKRVDIQAELSKSIKLEDYCPSLRESDWTVALKEAKTTIQKRRG